MTTTKKTSSSRHHSKVSVKKENHHHHPRDLNDDAGVAQQLPCFDVATLKTLRSDPEWSKKADLAFKHLHDHGKDLVNVWDRFTLDNKSWHKYAKHCQPCCPSVRKLWNENKNDIKRASNGNKKIYNRERLSYVFMDVHLIATYAHLGRCIHCNMALPCHDDKCKAFNSLAKVLELKDVDPKELDAESVDSSLDSSISEDTLKYRLEARKFQRLEEEEEKTRRRPKNKRQRAYDSDESDSDSDDVYDSLDEEFERGECDSEGEESMNASYDDGDDGDPLPKGVDTVIRKTRQGMIKINKRKREDGATEMIYVHHKRPRTTTATTTAKANTTPLADKQPRERIHLDLTDGVTPVVVKRKKHRRPRHHGGDGGDTNVLINE